MPAVIAWQIITILQTVFREMTSVSECRAVMAYSQGFPLLTTFSVCRLDGSSGDQGEERREDLQLQLLDNNCIPFVNVSLTTLISLLQNSPCHILHFEGEYMNAHVSSVDELPICRFGGWKHLVGGKAEGAGSVLAYDISQ